MQNVHLKIWHNTGQFKVCLRVFSEYLLHLRLDRIKIKKSDELMTNEHFR